MRVGNALQFGTLIHEREILTHRLRPRETIYMNFLDSRNIPTYRITLEESKAKQVS
jgi:hypothetical protein